MSGLGQRQANGFLFMEKLRIAEVGTIWETTPPELYGGTERVVSELTEALAAMGHDVTLFATGDSKTSAKLSSTYPRAAYRDGISWENFLYPLQHISEPFLRAKEFDIIHVHLNRSQDYVALPMSRLVKTPTVFTLHFQLPTTEEIGRKDRRMFLEQYRDCNFISISNAQRTMDLNYVATVYNGLDFSNFIPRGNEPREYLAWIGRFCHEKGAREAIETAKRSGQPIILAGKIDRQKKEYLEYYEKYIEPEIDGKQVKYIGEVNDVQKIELLQRAIALINPINWNEPFGLTMIEAMAMGVPVIAIDRGPVREIVKEGETGFIVKNVTEMVRAVGRISELDRSKIHTHSLSHFSAQTMALNYVDVFRRLVKVKR